MILPDGDERTSPCRQIPPTGRAGHDGVYLRHLSHMRYRAAIIARLISPFSLQLPVPSSPTEIPRPGHAGVSGVPMPKILVAPICTVSPSAIRARDSPPRFPSPPRPARISVRADSPATSILGDLSQDERQDDLDIAQVEAEFGLFGSQRSPRALRIVSPNRSTLRKPPQSGESAYK